MARHTALGREARAIAALALGGVLWGLYWIPLRALDAAGVSGGWPTVLLLAGAGMVLPLLLRQSTRPSAALLFAGAVAGCAFALYSTALLLTDIVRALLLFYITPIWGTLLGRLWLAEAITPARISAIVMSLLGLVVLLGTGDGKTVGPGDALALLSGFVWAAGSLFLHRATPEPRWQTAAFVFGALVLSLALLPLVPATGAPSLALAFLALPAAIYMLPMIALTVWPASILTPARVGLILMTEVVVGLASAAALAGEPFGAREAAGGLLIVSAALIEVAFGKRR